MALQANARPDNTRQYEWVEPEFIEYDGNDPWRFVISLNLQRRHLTSDQRAAIAVDFLDHYKVAAKERQGERADLCEKIRTSDKKGRATKKAAEDFHTNEKYVEDLAKIKEDDPDVFEKIKAGEASTICGFRQAAIKGSNKTAKSRKSFG